MLQDTSSTIRSAREWLYKILEGNITSITYLNQYDSHQRRTDKNNSELGMAKQNTFCAILDINTNIGNTNIHFLVYQTGFSAVLTSAGKSHLTLVL